MTHRCSWGKRWLDKYRDGRPGQKQIIIRPGEGPLVSGVCPSQIEAISPYFRGDYRNFQNGCLITKARLWLYLVNYRAPVTPSYYGVGFRAFCVKKTRVIISLPSMPFRSQGTLPDTTNCRLPNLECSLLHPFLATSLFVLILFFIPSFPWNTWRALLTRNEPHKISEAQATFSFSSSFSCYRCTMYVRICMRIIENVRLDNRCQGGLML